MLLFLGVVPEYQCAVKREAKKAQKDKEKPNSTTLSPTPTTKNNLNHMHDIEMKVRSDCFENLTRNRMPMGAPVLCKMIESA